MAINAIDKKYLDANGVKTLWKKVTARVASDVKTETDNRVAAIGTLTVADGKTATVENAIAKTTSDLEAKISTLDGAAIKAISVNGAAQTVINNAVAITDVASATDLAALTTKVGTASGTDGEGQAVAATGLTATIETHTSQIATLQGLHATGKTVAEEVTAVTGTPDSGKTLQAEVDAVEGRLDVIEGEDTVTGSVKKALKDAKAYTDEVKGGLDADFSGTNAVTTADGHVTIGIKEEDGVITNVTVADSDIASAKSLNDLTTYVGTASVEADAEKGTEAKAATGLTKQVEDLEAAVGEGGSVESQIKAITGTPDKDTTIQAEVDAVEARLDVIEGDGTVAGSVKKALKDAKDYTDAQIDALGGDVTSDDDAYVTVEVKTEDGEVSDVIVTNKDTTLRSDITALQATHAKKDDGTLKTVATEVNEAVTSLVDGAPEALDTLKEIADWIANQGTVEGKDGQVVDTASLVARVDANTTSIGVKGVEAAEGVEAVTATGLYKYVDDSVAAEKTAREAAINGLDVDTYKDGVSSTSGHVTVGIQETDGKISAFTVADSDIASATLLGTTSDAKTAATAFGYIAKEAADRAAAIEALDNDLTGTNAVSSTSGHVTVGIKEEDGVITTLTVADSDVASKSSLDDLTTYVGTAKAGETAGTGLTGRIESLETAVGEGGSVDSQIDAKINALDADIKSSDNADAAAGKGTNVNVEIVEADGKITAVKVTESDIASAALLGTTSDAKTAATAFGYIAKEADRATTAETTIATYVGTASGTDTEGKAVAATGLTLLVETNAANISANAADIDALESAYDKLVALTDDEITAAIADAEKAEA